MSISLSDWAKEYLWCFIRINNPELAAELEDVDTRNTYLASKATPLGEYFDDLLSRNIPDDVIEELALKPLTAELIPSRYNYVVNVLRTSFPVLFKRLLESGKTKTVAIKLVRECKPDFDRYALESEIPCFDRTYYAAILRMLQYMQVTGINPC